MPTPGATARITASVRARGRVEVRVTVDVALGCQLSAVRVTVRVSRGERDFRNATCTWATSLAEAIKIRVRDSLIYAVDERH